MGLDGVERKLDNPLEADEIDSLLDQAKKLVDDQAMFALRQAEIDAQHREIMDKLERRRKKKELNRDAMNSSKML